MATQSYNTSSGGTGVKLTDKQFASLSPDMQAKYAPKNQQTPSAITSPAPAPKSVQPPVLPTPTAPSEQENYFLSAAEQTKLARASLEDAYKSQSDQLERKIESSELAMANLGSKQQSILENDVEPLMRPFREDFEKGERNRLKVEENYFKNQSLANELEGLLNEGNVLIAQQKGQPIGQQLLNKRVNKTLSDISARTGVIEAVMAARNSQIGQAYNLIDRSVQAMTADRKDQLSYYETVLDFYQNAKDEEGKKLFKLEGEKSGLIQEQIGLIKHDLAQAEQNAQHIKDLMQDPDTAAFMAQAGVTLNDTPDVVNQKMAAQSLRQQTEDIKNRIVTQGYEFVPFATGAPGEQTISVGGKELTFKPGARMQEEIDLENAVKYASLRSANANAAVNELQYAQAMGGGGMGNGDIPFQSTIENAASFATSVAGQKRTLSELNNLAETGQFSALQTRLQNLAKSSLPAADKTDMNAAERNVKALTRMEGVLTEYVNAGGDLGFLKGKADQIATKFGQLKTDPRFKEIATEMEAAYQQYRSDMTGAAFGVAEDAEYRRVLPSSEKTFELNLAVISGMRNYLNNRVNDTYGGVLGEGYANLVPYANGTASMHSSGGNSGGNEIDEYSEAEAAYVGQTVTIGGVEYIKLGPDEYEEAANLMTSY